MSIATSLSGASLTAAHRRFEAALPAIDRTLSYLFRRWPYDRRDEALADARAAAWHAWYGLLRRGKDPESVGVTGLAANAARYVRNGRRLGCGTSGHATDVMDPVVGRRHGLRVVSLDESEGETAGSWRECLAVDHQFTPADAACFRLDFARWLEGLPSRKRQIADLLTEGNEGVVIARMMSLTPGRVSQVRDELNASWRAFQSQGEMADVASGCRAGRS